MAGGPCSQGCGSDGKLGPGYWTRPDFSALRMAWLLRLLKHTRFSLCSERISEA